MTTLAIPALKTCDVVSIADLTGDEIRALHDLAADVKADIRPYRAALDGRSVIMLFEKPSLRTRVSFEVGIARMGGIPMYFDHSQQRIGERESVKDYAMNLERWVDCIIARVYSHAVLAEMAHYASVPVINALCDLEHPCQALADFFTLKERLGTLEGARLAYIGDGNNVCHSLLLTAAKLGVDMTIITPKGFEPQFEVLRKAQADQIASGARITVTNDPNAIRGHHAVYTDVWVSMGQAHQASLRESNFAPYLVDAELMREAGKGIDGGAVFMHCLPAKRGMEVTNDVIDSDRSIVYDQAENRMHVQNALLLALLSS